MTRRKGAAASSPRPPDEIARGFVHVLFEVDEFFSGARELYGPHTRKDYIAILEAYLIHARNLIAFVGPNNYWDPRDMKPGDFGVAWNGPTEAVGDRLVAIKNVIHQHEAHLSWERAREWSPDDDPRPEFQALPSLLMPILTDFARRLVAPWPDHAQALSLMLDRYRVPAVPAPSITSTTDAVITVGSLGETGRDLA